MYWKTYAFIIKELAGRCIKVKPQSDQDTIRLYREARHKLRKKQAVRKIMNEKPKKQTNFQNSCRYFVPAE